MTTPKPMSGMNWQPIETAPQNGYFIVYEDGAYRMKMRHDGKWLDTADFQRGTPHNTQ